LTHTFFLFDSEKPERRREGFTLIELLLSLPSLLFLQAFCFRFVQSQNQAQGIQCMGNNRQMMLAWRLYSEDNRDIIPGNGDVPFRGGISPNWTGGSWLTLNNPNDPNNWNHELYTKKKSTLALLR